MKTKLNLLINLPHGFFKTPELKPVWRRLATHATLRKTSHNTQDEIARDLAWADAVIMWAWPTIDTAMLAKAPRLKFTGYINVAREGAAAALRKGIAISEARSGWSPAVAEMALTLILGCLRKTSDYHAAMRGGTEKWGEGGMFPLSIDPLERQLTGRSVGIVGFGGIGRRLAELLAPFHTSLRVYDPFVTADVIKRHGGTKTALLPLVAASEIVVLAAAATSETKHLIDKKCIASLRPNALFVNISRSALVDMPALLARLKKGDIIAALDVFDREPLEKTSPLRALPNAYLTPHRAGGLRESVVRILTGLTDDFEAWLKRKPRKLTVTKQMLASLG